MDIRAALKGQYGAGLAMLRLTVERCPDEIWVSGQHPRTYWRIAFHAIFFTHLYLQPNEEAFRRWEKHRDNTDVLWATPDVVEPYSRADLLGYIDEVRASVAATVDALDLDSDETGFSWYPNMGKLDHQIMNVRHLQGHVGQLSEILMAHGIDTDWVGITSA